MTTPKTPVPKNSDTPPVTEVFDLDAAKAQRFEAGNPNSFTFRFAGETFDMALDLKTSVLRKLKEVDASDIEGTFEIMLGKEQSAKFFEADPTVRDLKDLMDAYQKSVGTSLPK